MYLLKVSKEDRIVFEQRIAELNSQISEYENTPWYHKFAFGFGLPIYTADQTYNSNGFALHYDLFTWKVYYPINDYLEFDAGYDLENTFSVGLSLDVSTSLNVLSRDFIALFSRQSGVLETNPSSYPRTDNRY